MNKAIWRSMAFLFAFAGIHQPAIAESDWRSVETWYMAWPPLDRGPGCNDATGIPEYIDAQLAKGRSIKMKEMNNLKKGEIVILIQDRRGSSSDASPDKVLALSNSINSCFIRQKEIIIQALIMQNQK